METMREPVGPGDLVERVCRATHAHDLQGIGACFAIDYRLEMPTHRQTVQVGAAPMASRPAATPPSAGSRWTER